MFRLIVVMRLVQRVGYKFRQCYNKFLHPLDYNKHIRESDVFGKNYHYHWLPTIIIYSFGSLINMGCEDYEYSIIEIEGAVPSTEDCVSELTMREKRFRKFASVEYREQIFMTPEDFLDSVLRANARPRTDRLQLKKGDLHNFRLNTPTNGSKNMFRKLGNNGIISYAEYMFLLSVLAEPSSGFRILYGMINMGRRDTIRKGDFEILERVLGGALLRRCGRVDGAPALPTPHRRHSESCYQVNMQAPLKPIMEVLVDDNKGLQRKQQIPTTLQLHLFGAAMHGEVTYSQFQTFIKNLRYELLDMEFQLHARGKERLTETQFAHIILNHTILTKAVADFHVRKLEALLEGVQPGITFDEFYNFFTFLQDLEEFKQAMRIYTISNYPISKNEFLRGVKICTGISLSRHTINIVFHLFDMDGDGFLNYSEFIELMKGRFQRSHKHRVKGSVLNNYRSCMRTYGKIRDEKYGFYNLKTK